MFKGREVYERALIEPDSLADRVSHPQLGEGEVLFCKDGFPKAKVRFGDRTEKVLVDELAFTP